MASGISEAESSSSSRGKQKWSDNIKVYTRRIHTNPRKNLVRITVSNNQSNGKSDGETCKKAVVESNGGDTNRVVESNGGDTNRVVDGTLTENDVGKNCEDVVEEVPENEDGVKEVAALARNEVGKNCENVVEEVPVDENVVEDMPATTDDGCIVEEAVTKPDDVEKSCEKIIEEVPSNVNSVEEVIDRLDSGKETLSNGDNVKEVSDKGNIIKEVTDDGSNKDVSEDVNNTEQVPNNETNIETQNDKTIVEGAFHNENNVMEAPYVEKNVVEGSRYEKNIEVPDDEIEIREEVPRKSFSPKSPVEEAQLLQPHHNPSNVETLTLSDDSSSHGLVEALPPNGHDRNASLTNGVIREERPMVSQVDDRLNISVAAAKSKNEVRDLKRKLEVELDQVRKMARKLQAKETQLNSVDFESRMVREEAPVGRLRFPVNGGMDNDINSMTGNEKSSYVGYSTPRPFVHISSSVTNSSYHGIGENVHEKEKRTPRANQFYQNSDFVLGKEKLPPAKSNRKAKSSGGSRKHGGRDFDSGFGFDKKFHKKCDDLLQKLRKHKHGWVFNVPVDVKRLGLHDYFDIIKHPMDLGTVKTRLTNNWYKTPREFAEDVRLTFHNAMTYNPEGQDVHIMAKELLRIFEEKWPSIEADYDRKLRYEMFRDVGTPTPTSRKLYAPVHHPIHMPLPAPPLLHLPQSFQESRNLERSQSMPVRPESRPKSTPSVGRTPAPKKPKAKDPNKRDMTVDEKQKLSTNLQCLPSDKLDAIVQIIKKRDSAFSQHDDEIEVDIDKVDAETLWELDRFVTNYKKRLSKYKRKAEIAMQARAELAMQSRAAGTETVQETVPPPPTYVEVPREDRTGEGNAGTSTHVQQEKHGDNASHSSNTSSSSSDSGSSSSDSDSDSSSDSESDEDR